MVLCPECTLKKATQRVHLTKMNLCLKGGHDAPAAKRTREWYVTRLSHQISARRLYEAERKFNARKERQRK